MHEYQVETPQLDEQRWRDWVAKGKLRDLERKRKWRLLGGAALAALLVAGAIYRFLPLS